MKKLIIRLTAGLLSLLLLLPLASAAEGSKTPRLDAIFTTADLMDATIADLLDAMEDGSLTSERLTQMYLDRIEAYDIPMELRTIINLNPNALEDARKADEARANGATGRLLGIPILVKDSIDVAGMPTTRGSYYYRNAVAGSDAEAVARLRAEGAVFLGKTNMSTFSESGANSISELAGMVGNAYDPTRTPAGSSGGSAVAVACCFCAAALGADTYSSLRRPASFAGIYTLRPSFGLVSQTGLVRLNYDQDVIGPMCRNAEDMALIFDVIAGTDPSDPFSADADSYVPDGGYTSGLKANGLRGKRIGYLANSFGYLYQAGTGLPSDYPQPLDAKIADMVERAKQTLVDGGAELVDLSDVLTEYYVASVTGNYTYGNMMAIREYVTEVLEENNIDAVIYVSQNDVAETQENPVGKFDNGSRYIYTFSPLGGLPETVLPMGLSETDPENGFPHALPLGLSMFSGYGKDDVLLQIAYAYDQIADVKTHPWTAPALPDPNLEAYAQELIAQAKGINRADYTSASLSAVDGALRVLAPVEIGEEYDTARYQAMVYSLASAMAGLKPINEEEQKPGKQTGGGNRTSAETETAASDTDELKNLLPTNTRFPWELPVGVTILMWALLYWYKRKFSKDDDDE
ncbi:MAG: amidase [Oscillospiraceae bacterium]|nr:amidase [Oscillospiraceae bacterium]